MYIFLTEDSREHFFLCLSWQWAIFAAFQIYCNSTKFEFDLVYTVYNYLHIRMICYSEKMITSSKVTDRMKSKI